jgi:hypothetical protein
MDFSLCPICADQADCFSNPGVIKKKLFADTDGNGLPTAPSKSQSLTAIQPHLTSIIAGTPTKPKATPKGKKSAPAATPSKKRAKKVDDDDEDNEDEGRSLLSKRKKSTKIVKAEDSDDD